MSARRSRRRIAWWSVLGAIGLVIVAGAWVGVRAVGVAADLAGLRDAPGQLLSAIEQGDLETAARVADQLAHDAARAGAVEADPLWRVAEIVPFAGDNLAAARVSATQISQLSADVAGPLLGLMSQLSASAQSAPEAVDVHALAAAGPALARAAETTGTAAAELAALDRTSLVAPLAGGVEQLDDAVSDLLPIVTSLSRGAQLLPPLLGADGPRSVVVVMQNSAEVRTGGGITGTFAELRTEGGRISLGRQFDSSAFAVADRPVADMPAFLSAAFRNDTGRFVQNATMTPDFSLTGRLVSQWWRSGTGSTPDAVVSVDPIVLRELLRTLGPVSVHGLEVTTDNVLDLLLVQSYEHLDDAGQNAFFADVTRAVLEGVVSRGDPVAMASVLTDAADAGRISLWSAREDEQAVIETTPLAGPEARQRAAGDGAFAVYLNDAAGTKMARFLDVAMSLSPGACRADGRPEYRIDVAVTSTAPADAASLSPYVTGGGMWGVAAGDLSTIVTVVAPDGAYAGGVTRDGGAVSSSEGATGALPSSSIQATLRPGESATFSFSFVLDAPIEGAPVLLHTPLLNDPPLAVSDAACAA